MGRVTSKLAKVIAIATVLLFVLSTVALAAMPSGTVVLGDKAFSLEYANDPAHLSEITQAFQDGGFKAYVKDFNDNWQDNDTGALVDASAIPAVTYKDANGTETQYAAGDGDVVTSGELKVVSVSAINGIQLKVEFSDVVDKDAAENENNYKIIKEDGTPISLTSTAAVLQDDEKSVVITLPAAITTKTSLAVTVQPIAKKDVSNTKTELFSTTLVVEDKVAPTITEIKSATNGNTASSVTIEFSEPVQPAATFKIDGSAVSGASWEANNESVTFSGLNLDATKTHTLEVIGLLDAAGNTISPNPTTKTFTISVDANAPVVSSVEAYGDKSILVTFSKKMNASTVTTSGNITIKDEKLEPVAVGTVYALPGDTTGTKFIVPVSSSVTLYSATQTSRTLTLVFSDNLQDSLGNKVSISTKSVTLNKDVNPPTISNVTYQTDVSGNLASLTVEFSEGLKRATITLGTSNMTVVDKDGVDVTSSFTSYFANATISDGDKKVTFVPASTATAFYGPYTLTFKKGFVQDGAETPNDSVAYTKTIDFGSAPSADFKLSDGAATYNASTQEISVNFGRVVKGGNVAGSATDGNNYTLNGVTIPAGSIVLDSTKKIATITLPADFIPANDTAAVFRIANVQDSNGVTITPYVQTLSVKDNTAPVLQSARVLDNSTIELTYNEDMAAVTNAQVGDEFVIYEGTTAKSLATSELVANSVSGFAKKITIHINKTTGGTPASFSPITASGSGSATIGGAYNGTSDLNYVVKVTAVDASSNATNVAVSTDGGSTFGVEQSYTAGMSIGNGLTLTISGINAVGDTFSFTATAAVAGTPVTLDLTKDISIKTISVTGAGLDIKDAANNNGQKGDVTVTVAK